MKKIVLTGGPCSGKTTVMRTLQEEFGDSIITVPEVATILLGNGFPVPGKDVDWSEEWQAALENAVVPLQRSIEDAFALAAHKRNCHVMVCDRGLLDGAAYTPGGLPDFCRLYGVDEAAAYKRYSAVIHLESVATADPEKYGKTDNESRFEPVERAAEVEHAMREAWKNHPRRLIISGRRGIEGKIAECMGIVRFLLAEKEAAP